MQRAERRRRDAEGTTWTPRWFVKSSDAELHDLEKDIGTDVWEIKPEYRESLTRRIAENGGENAAAKSVDDVAFDPWEFPDTAKMQVAAAAPAAEDATTAGAGSDVVAKD
jgi:hypothetical protein